MSLNPENQQRSEADQENSINPVSRESALESLAQSISQADGGKANPFLNHMISADAREHRVSGSPDTNKFGQPVVHVDPKVNYFGSDLPGTLALHRNYEFSDYLAKAVSDYYMRPDRYFPTPEQFKKLAINGVAGFFPNQKSHTIEPDFGIDLVVLQLMKAQLYIFGASKWQNNQLSHSIQPFKSHQGTPVLPMLGDFYLDGEPLSDEVLERLSISTLGVPASDKSEELLSANVSAFGLGGRSILIPSAGSVFFKQNEKGEMELLKDFSDPKLTKSKIVPLPLVALQYIGVGTRRYCYHLAQKKPNGEVDLKPGEVILNTELNDREDVAIVQRSEYVGKSGIFLDLQHQPHTPCPTGALINVKLSIEIETELIKRNARLAGVTIDYATLLRKDQLEEAVGHKLSIEWSELQVGVRAYIDDTRRLGSIDKSRDEGSRDPSPEFIGFIRSRSNSYSVEERDKYLSELARNLGHNLRVCLNAGYTIQKEQESTDNLNIWGKILDSENFLKMRSRYECLPLIKSWTRDLFNVASSAGISCNAFLRHEAIKSFLENVFPDKYRSLITIAHRMVAINEVKQEKIAALALLIGIEWVKESLRRDRLQVNQQKLERWGRVGKHEIGPALLDTYISLMIIRCGRRMFDDATISPLLPEHPIKKDKVTNWPNFITFNGIKIAHIDSPDSLTARQEKLLG